MKPLQDRQALNMNFLRLKMQPFSNSSSIVPENTIHPVTFLADWMIYIYSNILIIYNNDNAVFWTIFCNSWVNHSIIS